MEPRVATEAADGAIPMPLWGKDHWSTLAYLETRIVDHSGVLDPRNMRCNTNGPHGHFAHVANDACYDTRLIGASIQSFHDDWDCIDDMVAAGLVEWSGTGVNPVFRLTDLGWRVAGRLRRHIAETRKSGTFRWPR